MMGWGVGATLVTYHLSTFRYQAPLAARCNDSPPRARHALDGNLPRPREYRGRWDGPQALSQALQSLHCFARGVQRHRVYIQKARVSRVKRSRPLQLADRLVGAL